MDQLLQQIVAGLEAGSYYSLIGLAIVVIMKSTDVPNFAMAEMGLVAAYVAWWLSDDAEVGLPFALAIIIGLVFAAAFGAGDTVLARATPYWFIESTSCGLFVTGVWVRDDRSDS